MKKIPWSLTIDACRWISRAAVALLLAWTTHLVAVAQTAPIANVGLTNGWATFGEVVPQGVATDGLQIGSLPTQTDVKTRWADGSIRFAVVTASVPSTGNYAVTAAAAQTGSFAPQLPSASVTLTIGGVLYTATLPPTPATDVWLNGPLVTEGRQVITPVSSSGAAHPFLRVDFDTRVYVDGKARVDVTVENVLDKVGATTVTYDAAISVDGQLVFSRSGVQHYYLTRWRKVFEVGAAPAAVTPDIFPANLARALPPYLSQVSSMVSSPTGTTYDILQAGALDTNMPDHGGRPELAPFPDWTARYLVHKDATQRSFVLANGDLSGSWPVHVREAENSTTSGVGTERLISLDQRPTIWYDSRAKGDLLDYVKGSPMPIIEYGSTTPGPGQSPLIPDNAHQPSLAYVPYLLTGDRYYAEEMVFWANYSMLRTYPADGVRGSQGILAYNEVRGFGWALRNIAEAAAYYPDSSPVKGYLSQKVTSNLQWLDAYANAQGPSNPFKILWLNKRPDGAQYIGLWEQNYLAYAIDRANKLGFAGGTAHRDAIARFQLRLFTSDPDYPEAQAAPYIVDVGTPSGSSFSFFTTMAQIWAGTSSQTRPFAGYYGPEARINLMMGVEAGWTGAQGAYDFLWPYIGTTVTYCATGPSQPDLSCRAGWALDFYPASATQSLPPPPPPPPATAISNVASGNLTTTSATVTWTTNVSADSRVDFGTTSAYGLTVTNATVVTSHSMNVTGLAPATTYHFKVTSQANGSVASSGDLTFTTANAPPTLAISNVATSNITSTSATVGWTTNVSADSRVDYGTSSSYGATATAATLVTSHILTLTGLTAATTYHFKITSQASGATVATGDLTFTSTAAAPPPPGAPLSIWSASATPAAIATNDTRGVELGLKFSSDVAGLVVGVRFYKGPTATGTHTASLWTLGGTRLATATFTSESASGWQQVLFATPVAISANTTYVVSYHTTSGNYAYTYDAFATSSTDAPPLHALSSGSSGGNGVYHYGRSRFPSATYRSTNYWVDVMFVPQ